MKKSFTLWTTHQIVIVSITYFDANFPHNSALRLATCGWKVIPYENLTIFFETLFMFWFLDCLQIYMYILHIQKAWQCTDDVINVIYHVFEGLKPFGWRYRLIRFFKGNYCIVIRLCQKLVPDGFNRDDNISKLGQVFTLHRWGDIDMNLPRSK